ncbi:TauD/TfdA family dioxygenase [Streptomyces sp. NPDC059850]|uniref:TauD/TfdA family dioxygenase n=1 Tax=Streptomyces sp. NPDC059850 TaxID=3346970 RepID=UPI0036573EE0
MSNVLTLESCDLVRGPTAPREFAVRLTGDGAGATVVSFPRDTDHHHNLELALGLLSVLGPILSVYPNDGCWSDLAVRTDVNPARTHGVGENRLHVDLVDRELSPRYIALYCVRNDPLNGGASALSDLWAAADDLTIADRDLLSRPDYSYWADKDVHGVGESLPHFPVLPKRIDNGTPIRFTSKMQPHLRQGQLVNAEQDTVPYIAQAFDRLVTAAYKHRTTVRLAPGQLLVFDQWRYAHGRMPLGPGQETLPAKQRRLLKQSYVGHVGTGGVR